jgi:hypothetical protein
MTTQPTTRPPLPSNDEEPSPDAMDRLWAALDASLDPPEAPTPFRNDGHAGQHQCLRCGWRWDCRECRQHGRHAHGPTHQRPLPKCCANVICRSAYWDVPAKTSRGRTPDQTDWDDVRSRMLDARDRRKRFRHLAKVRKLAASLGLDITDPRTGRGPQVGSEPAPTATATATIAPPTTAIPRPESLWPARARTVPPPPGLEDLEHNAKGN